ncbi:MAG: HRDC domain-containing protein [Actinomycetota bacterium]|nr:HRDC domain-containing protein [Actinomycetota bacterium]MED5292507.1 HRDC domain-containing protein [Actinomycetota bacterium]
MTRLRRLTATAEPNGVVAEKSESVTYSWVATQEHFAGVIAKALKVNRVALDTEFHRERTYWPKVALLQLKVEAETFLVDPLVVDLAPLAEVLTSDVVFVMHAAAQDIEVLERACGVGPKYLFDTQVAAGFTGMSTPSLSALVERYIGLRLPKGDRLTDWFERPLRKNQQDYAANDVRYLFEVHDQLISALKETGRLDWALTECELARQRFKPNLSPELAWTRIKEARHLRGKPRCVAAVLAQWREITAQRKDVPIRFILSDLALVGIAQRAPTTLNELKAIRGLDGRSLKDAAGDEILGLVSDGMRMAVDDVATLDVDEGPQLGNEMRAAVTLVSAWISQVAKDEAIDPALLATRSDINDLLRGAKNPRLGTGWRSDLVGTRIEDLVEGRASLAFDAGGGLVLEPRSAFDAENKPNFDG